MLERRIEPFSKIAAITLLVIGCTLVVQPFLAAALFAAAVCLATWPVYAWLRCKLAGRHTIAALLMTLLLILAGFMPFIVLVSALVDDLPRGIEWVRGLFTHGLPDAPAWLTGLPLVGEHIDAYWQRIAASQEELVALVKRLIDPARVFLLAVGGVLGEGILQLTLAAIIGFFFYRDGDALVATLRSAAARLAGPDAEPVLLTINNTVVSVMYGIVGTALAQGFVAAIGFRIAGIEEALLLGAATFLLSVLPFGAPMVSIGAALWLFNQGSTGWALFTLAWGVLVVANIDNVVKPMLISRGSAMPFVLVLLGIFGGVIAFGFIGVFLGPTLLAVAYSLIRKWVPTEAPAAAPVSSASATPAAAAVTPLKRASPYPSSTCNAAAHAATPAGSTTSA